MRRATALKTGARDEGDTNLSADGGYLVAVLVSLASGRADSASTARSRGQGLDGQGLNGQGLNGQGLNGQGLNGQGLNGQGLNGQGLNGQGVAPRVSTARG